MWRLANKDKRLESKIGNALEDMQKSTSNNSELKYINLLCGEKGLRGLPLAIKIAASYLYIDLHETENRFEVLWKELDIFFGKNKEADSIRYIFEKNYYCLSDLEKDKMRILAFLDPDYIPMSLISGVESNDNSPKLKRSKRELFNRSLIEDLKGEEAVRIHRLVQITIQNMLTPDETTNALIAGLVNVIKLCGKINNENYSSESMKLAYQQAAEGKIICIYL